MKRETSRLATFAAAAVMALSGAVAMAQPAGGQPHGPGHGPGAGMEIERVLGAVKDKLNLNTSQQLMWDSAAAQTKAARVAGRADMQKIHDAMSAALATPAPDLAAVAAVADSVHADRQAVRRSVRDQWLQIYATFSPEQKVVVRDALAQQLARMESFGAKMREHMQRGS